MDYYDFLPQLNKTAEKYKEKAQQKLKYCVTCQPYDGGDYIWIMGTETTVDEIFEDVNVPEKYREDIAKNLNCPNCGKSGFEQYEVVGTEDADDIEKDRQINLIEKFATKLESLRLHLENYPSLALAHPMGKKIRKEIFDCREKSIKIPLKQWSRARLVKHSKVFEQSDMMAPGVGLSSGGRFHHQGQSVLYLAENDSLAMYETLDKPEEPSLIWVQKYKQRDIIEDILDLRYEWEMLWYIDSEVLQALLASRFIFEKVEDRTSNWRPQYFLTNFIADCAREAGFKGIIYSSSRTTGNNLVLFDPIHPSVEPYENPQVFIHNPSKDLFKDLEDWTRYF
ncbi:RES family NAD+ phosphorylase [Bacillaceae bacterium CLA-AA-H227]|uniref:RES family NAD+ phosphorylase n=1 Tax=Robertmurraya yapensis (ex Hitch et al 2024) TaxID=3133160 RepID=A0ACC6SFN2_9BACI